ncbi:MAG: NAD-dependent epimerase/dehydratase family protein [Bacteroidetes bacterium]|nr:MAG: NAD-dependent epimerase/dehydratase family protein [Bacteroidota bacterium]
MSKKVIITGATGMVGKGVLLECLEDDRISEVLVVNRSTVGISHPKLTEILHKDFADLSPIKDQLHGYDACFYCMGVSSAGMNADAYYHITYTMTEAFMDAFPPENMVFIYVSGTGTDSSEKGRIRWARVKGKTENVMFAKGFKDAYAWRPGGIIPEKGIRSKTPLYQFFYTLLRPFFPLFKRMNSMTTTTRIGVAMINILFHPQELKHLENPEINEVAKK